MTDTKWEEEGAAAPKKRRIPVWAWWTCGSGCLLLTVLVAIGAIFFGRLIRDALDPEKAWAGVGEILPFDQRPDGWDARGTTRLGTGMYFLTPPGGDAVLIVQRFRGQTELEPLFDPASTQNSGSKLFGSVVDPERDKLVVQGREVTCLRFRSELPEGFRRSAGSTSGIRIDLSARGIPALVQISLRDGQEPVSAETVVELLAPFDLWRGVK